ncbi:hypothetical protein [Pseudomonas alkylphenolica]|uniref:hypothetical protein n=1 Tax=Pseudomonas alkylphenolica TaxID=237609 RepID=UPI000FBACC7C
MTTTNSTQETQSNLKALTKSLSELLTNPLLTVLLSFLLGIGSGALSVYFIFDSKVTEAAKERLNPYEQLFTGLGLNQGEEYAEAARTFHKLVKSKEFESLPESSKNLAFDGMILAIAETDNIDEFKGGIKKYKDRMIATGEETPWRLHHLAWALMRDGNLNEAADYFEKSADSYKSKRDYSASADPTRGLLLTALFKGNIDKAIELSQDIKKVRPSVYRNNRDLIAEVQEFKNSRYFDTFSARSDGRLDLTIEKYISRLIKSEEQHSGNQHQ